MVGELSADGNSVMIAAQTVVVQGLDVVSLVMAGLLMTIVVLLILILAELGRHR